MPAFQAYFMGIILGYAGKYHGLIWGTVRVFMGMPRVSMGKNPVNANTPLKAAMTQHEDGRLFFTIVDAKN